MESVALLAEGVDRNEKACGQFFGLVMSPSSRRAWIEIFQSKEESALPAVALLAEGVDRNVYALAVAAAEGSRPPRGGRG